MSYKSLYLKPVQKRLKVRLQGAYPELEFKTATLYHLISARFGLWSNELTREYDVPFMQRNTAAFGQSATGLQFGRVFLIDRIKQLLGTDEWKAQKIAIDINEEIEEAGLKVDQLRVLFDPAYNDYRTKIFKALNDEFLPATSASAAIANGDLPPLPTNTLREHLQALREKPLFMQSGTLETFVKGKETYLWQYPSALFKEAATALIDVVHEPFRSAEIGMGFALIQPFKLPNNDVLQYAVAAPMYHYSAESRASWSEVSIHTNTSSENGFIKHPLSQILEGGVESLPRMYMCSHCGLFFAENVIGLDRTCNC